MILYVNNENEIKDVNTTEDKTLTPLVVNDDTTFDGWSIAKICCHKVEVSDGYITGFAPYVDSRLIEHIDQLGKANASTQAQLDYVTMMSDIDI